MYSFYGGQKGQDFKISHIFANRSKDLLADLQARWYSPINVGEYVFISYGNIAEQSQVYVNSNGYSTEIPSNYQKNLDIDLLNCGKSYSNSLWQKIYVDENRTISPVFPESDDENIYVFINFEDSIIIDDETNEFKDIEGREIDKDGNVVDSQGNIVLLRQIPGQSLKEVSNLYTEENFGFGYRLVACVTGQTPKLEAYYETIEIDEGDPYVTLDIRNLEKPKLKFYIQKAQTLNDEVKVVTLPPLEDPDVDLVTSGYVNINGKNYKASIAHPILTFEMPRAVQFHSGFLFGRGNLSDYPYNIASEERYSSTEQFTIKRKDIVNIQKIAFIINYSLKKSIIKATDNQKRHIDTITFRENVKKYINNFHPELKQYFIEEYSLIDFLEDINLEKTNNNIPWYQYGLSLEEALKEKTFQDYCTKIAQQLKNIVILLKDYIINQQEETLNNIPWGNYNLFYRSWFDDILTLEDKIKYCKNYIDGIEKVASIVMLTNIFNLYNPVVNFKELIIEIYNTEEKYYFADTIEKYFRNILEELYYLQLHFNYLLEEALPGDMYIHTPSGRLYQFSHIGNSGVSVDEKYLTARYIGALTAPAPEIESTIQKAFILDEEGNYVVNDIKVRDNILISDNNLGYKEKYIFDIPERPDWQVQETPIENAEEPRVEISIVEKEDKSDGIYDINFYLPRAVHIYTDSYLPEDVQIFFENSTDEAPTMIPTEVPANKVCNGDIYIHTAKAVIPTGSTINYDFGYDLRDEHRGYFYVYTGGIEDENGNMVGGSWVRQGSILGPIGIPDPVKLITLKATYDFPEESRGTARELSDDIYWVHALDVEEMNTLKEVISYIFTEYLTEDDYPKSWLGEMIQFLVLQAPTFYETNEDGEQIESEFYMDSSFWGQWNGAQSEWYITLMTAVGAYMSNTRLEGEAAKYMTYTAEYLNEKIPEWDASYY